MAATATGTVDSKIVLTSDSGTAFPALANSATWAPAQKSYTNGTANGSIDISYASRLTISSGTPVSIDLSGSLKDLIQANAVFVEVAVIGLYNRSTNVVAVTGNLMGTLLGTNGASISLQGGGRFLMDFPGAGIAVTNTTGDTLTFTSASGTNDVDVAIGGRSA